MNIYTVLAYLITALVFTFIVFPAVASHMFNIDSYTKAIIAGNAIVFFLFVLVILVTITIAVISGHPDIIERMIEGVKHGLTNA